MKSARCNGQNVVLQVFFKKYITPFFVFVKVQLASNCTRRTDNFKLSTIPGNSVYINISMSSVEP